MSTTINAINQPQETLQTFSLPDLQQFTMEGSYSSAASKDFHLFYVGRDDVHDILKYVLSRVTVSLYLNMFGFDDPELNDILMKIALDPNITMLITLDRSQAGGVHEKNLIALDQAKNLAAYNTHFVIGESSTHQISHTKGFVADGIVGGEGSTNWSSSGEGTFLVTGNGKPGGAGYKAQNNTQSIFTDTDTLSRFSSELVAEHLTAKAQMAAVATAKAKDPAVTQDTINDIAQKVVTPKAGAVPPKLPIKGEATAKTATKKKAAPAKKAIKKKAAKGK